MRNEDVVSVACVNFKTTWGDKAANLSKMKDLTRDAARQGNNIVIFPELALSGYECSEGTGPDSPCEMHRSLAEEIPGPSTTAMAELARELDVYVVFGMPELNREDLSRPYIAAAVIGPEGVLGSYRKVHLPLWPRFTENLCFAAGDDLPVWETRYCKIGVLICYDFYFYPELARIMALKDAALLINISASGIGPGKPYYLVQQTGSRATENLVYAASANLVGVDRVKEFYGHSTIAGPNAPRLACVFAEGGEREEIVSATLNLRKLRALRADVDWQRSRRCEVIQREMAKVARS